MPFLLIVNMALIQMMIIVDDDGNNSYDKDDLFLSFGSKYIEMFMKRQAETDI